MTYIKQAKKHMKLGIVGMAGMGAMGAMTNVPGMPAAASGVATTAGAGIGLAQVGQIAETGKVIVDDMAPKKKKTGNKYIDRII